MTDKALADHATAYLEQLVKELLVLTEKYERSKTPQGKNLYGKKVKRLQTKVLRLVRVAQAATA